MTGPRAIFSRSRYNASAEGRLCDEVPDAARPHQRCYGTVYSLYFRDGKPPKWRRAGRMCRSCGHFWRDDEF